MLLRRIARPLLAGIFISGGINQLRDPEGHAKAAHPVLDRVAEVVPLQAQPSNITLVRLDAGVKIGAGTLLALGKAPRLAAATLAASLLPTTVGAHRFWEIEDAEQRKLEQVQFTKNLGLLGGLLLAVADTEGKPSLVWRVRHPRHTSPAPPDVTAGLDRLTERVSGVSATAAESAGRLRGQAAESAGRLSGQFSESAGRLSGQAAERAGRVGEQAAEIAGHASERAAAVASRVGERLSERIEGLLAEAERLLTEAEQQAGVLAERARGASQRAGRRAGKRLERLNKRADKRLKRASKRAHRLRATLPRQASKRAERLRATLPKQAAKGAQRLQAAMPAALTS